MDRAAFAERIRLQLVARYHGAQVDVDEARFALHVTGSGLDLMLPLAPLFHACERQPGKVPSLIGEYVASVEHQLTPQPAIALSLPRLLWCVRNDNFLGSHGRVGDLLRAPIGADMTAFVAEELPGSIMRGVPRDEWTALGLSDQDVLETADCEHRAAIRATCGTHRADRPHPCRRMAGGVGSALSRQHAACPASADCPG